MTDAANKPFQLDPKDFKTGNMMVDGLVGQVVKLINNLDLNKDGHKDIAQIAPLILQALPLLILLNEVVDFEDVTKQLAENPAIKDKEVFKNILLEVGKLLEQASALKPAA